MTTETTNDAGTLEGTTQVPPTETVVGNTSTQQTEVPEKYELSLSEGSFLSKELLGSVITFAQDNKLTMDQAKTMLSTSEKIASDTRSNLTEDVKKQLLNDREKEIEGWATTTKNDPTLGGDNFNRSVELSKRTLSTFGSDSFVKMLNETGVGNHPEVVRFLSSIGSLLEDDKLVMAEQAGPSEKPVEELFYGKTK